LKNIIKLNNNIFIVKKKKKKLNINQILRCLFKIIIIIKKIEAKYKGWFNINQILTAEVEKINKQLI
jgi:hypothetical protein